MTNSQIPDSALVPAITKPKGIHDEANAIPGIVVAQFVNPVFILNSGQQTTPNPHRCTIMIAIDDNSEYVLDWAVHNMVQKEHDHVLLLHVRAGIGYVSDVADGMLRLFRKQSN